MNPILFPITWECNLSCSYCSSRNRGTVDIEKSLSVIAKGKNDWVWITGGEPLTVPNITEVCRRLQAMGKKVGLTTNGTIRNFDVLEHLDRLGVSIDGDESFTDAGRGAGTYQKAVAFLEEAVKHPLETVIMATMTARNPKQEDYLESLGEQLGVTYLQVTLC